MKTLHTQEHIGITGRVRVIKKRADGSVEVGAWSKNLIVNTDGRGKSIIAQRLGGTNTYTLNITHGDIGTGTTAPAASDTQLQTPTVRVAKTNAVISLNIVTIQFFFSDATLPNGTYYEFGTFVDGTATISTGRLFNRALFGSAYTKASGEDTTVEVEFTIN